MRPTDRFPWERRWVPGNEELPLDADGFYAEPEEEFLQSVRVGRKLSELRDVPCLVLLGEAGMGKTTVVEDHVAASDGEACVVDLATIGHPPELGVEIEAAVSDGVEELFFDGLDEARLRIPTILDSLLRALASPARTARIRIVCRAGEWPGDGKDKLEKWFGNGKVQIFRLMPLSREDVVTAARVREIDPEKFFRALFVAGVAPLAAVPITLGMLLKEYDLEAELPTHADELYERGCKCLLDEVSEDRKLRPYKTGRPPLDSEQRLYVAARIAACLMLCDRRAIAATGNHAGEREILSIEDLVDGFAEVPEGRRITEDCLREVLETALFRSVGQGRFEFMHRTFGEYLAARWILGPPSIQHKQLLGGATGRDVRVPTQLHGVVAWVAAQDAELLHLIATSDPDILLGSAHLLSHADRSQLVDALLEAYERLEAFPRWRADPAYSRLSHPELRDQLRPWVTGERGNRLARLAAIDIADACTVEACRRELLAVVENGADDHRLRVRALAALIHMPGQSCTPKLRALALGEAEGEDPDDELRGLALRYLWPDQLAVEEVMNSLTHPKAPELLGVYRFFIEKELVAGLRDRDLPCTLRCLSRRLSDLCDRRSTRENVFKRLVEALWERAVNFEPSPQLTAAMASIFVSAVHAGLASRSNKLRGHTLDCSLRQALLQQLVRANATQEESLDLAFGYLITPDDLDWVLEQLEHEAVRDEVSIWSRLAVRLWHWSHQPAYAFERLYVLADRLPEVGSELGIWLDGCPIRGEEAERLQEYHRDLAQIKNADEQTAREQWTCEKINEVADHLLNRAASGEPLGWWNLVRLLKGARPMGLNGGEQDLPPFKRWRLETYPAFPCLDGSLRARLAEVADRYLHQGSPGIHEPEGWWFRTDLLDWRPAAAIAALGWLREHAPSVFTRLPAEVWARWAPAIVEYGDHRAEPGRALADVCYRLAPEALLSALRERLELRLSRGETECVLLRLAQRLEDDRVLDFLAERLRMERLDPRAAFEIAQMLAEKRPDACEEAIRRGGEGHDGG